MAEATPRPSPRSERPRLPVIAIVGRPNVGKSSLFNRYAGHRRALVHDLPGVTRDRIAEEAEVGGRRVLLVDTAGLDDEAPLRGGGLERAVQAQARSAIRSADAVLFVVDGRVGLLPGDLEIARSLRRAGRPVAVAVNKIDHPRHASLVAEFHALGIEPVRGVSAEHGRGAFELLEELVAGLPEGSPVAREAGEALRIALVGRPNVGKSSLANRLAGEERVVVSEVPGTTRDAVDLVLERDGRTLVLVDTAGLRRPGRRNRVVEPATAVMTLRALERAEVAFVVFDAAEGVRDQDVRIAGLARDRGCAVALVANKWDLVLTRGPDAPRRLQAEIERRFRFMADAPLLTVSALRGTRVARLFGAAERLSQAARTRIETAELNRWLQEATARHEPAMAQRGTRRRPIKFFYATQTADRPPTFVLFCTDPKAVKPTYGRFLENRLRERFGLAGTPVRLILRARSGTD